MSSKGLSNGDWRCAGGPSSTDLCACDPWLRGGPSSRVLWACDPWLRGGPSAAECSEGRSLGDTFSAHQARGQKPGAGPGGARAAPGASFTSSEGRRSCSSAAACCLAWAAAFCPAMFAAWSRCLVVSAAVRSAISSASFVASWKAASMDSICSSNLSCKASSVLCSSEWTTTLSVMSSLTSVRPCFKATSHPLTLVSTCPSLASIFFSSLAWCLCMFETRCLTNLEDVFDFLMRDMALRNSWGSISPELSSSIILNSWGMSWGPTSMPRRHRRKSATLRAPAFSSS
mmetsp:Transcript_120964/g.353414  ORF Transcript_120964/g.353414 Transcript_120964/m.353414 type:complete len:287 (-) Transcript_120964:1346-2206(-)